MKKIAILCAVLVAAFVSSCKKEKPEENKPIVEIPTPKGKLELIFTPMVGDKGLYYDSAYTNPAGEVYELTTLKYYISDIGLSKVDGSEVGVDGYRTKLVNYDSPNFDAGYGMQSYKLTMNAAVGQYSDIRYDIGVPSEVNHKDATTNPYPLDLSVPGMYWNWNSGYVFLLAEGKGAGVAGDYFHFGIGTDLRMMSCFFGNMLVTTPKFEIKEGKTTRVYFTLDFNKVLKNQDGSNYSFGGYNFPQANVHGGYYADMIRSNVLQAIELQKVEIID